MRALLPIVFAAIPVLAQAQGVIAGVARDASAGVLPGVTIEVASPALIEKTRSAVSDQSGQYRVVALPDGRYTVSFTLAGFTTVVRTNVEVLANFTATVNADMAVGALNETITVSGEAPVVDVQSASQSRALTAEVFGIIPTGKSFANMAALIPSVAFNGRRDVGGAEGNSHIDVISSHGSNSGDSILMLDGLRIGNMQGTGERSNYNQSPLLFDQVNVEFSGQSGEAGSNGVQINTIPRSGGNSFSGTGYLDFANDKLQGSNLSQHLIDRGVSVPAQVYQLYDLNGSLGGPLVRDRVWFYTTARYVQSGQYVPGLFFNADPKAPLYVPDRSRQGFDDFQTRDNSIRVTTLPSTKHKLSFFYNNQSKCNCHLNITGNGAPESTTESDFRVDIFQATWTYTATNRLLFEAGMSPNSTPFPTTVLADSTEVPITNSGFSYRGPALLFSGRDYKIRQQSYRASMAYVTGSHNLKVGWDMLRGLFQPDQVPVLGGLTYTFASNVPTAVTLAAPTVGTKYNLDYSMGIYLQDRWTVRRATFTGGLRLDMQRESADEVTYGPSIWDPNRNRTFPAVTGIPDWKDIDPRFGVSYDVFGNGRTALKASVSRGVTQETTDTVRLVSAAGQFNNTNNAANGIRTTRTWNDSNFNFTPECDLRNPASNGECGPYQNQNFANNAVGFAGAQLDPDYVQGWGKRQYNWEYSAGVQHEIAPRVAGNFSYFARRYGNFTVTDDLNVSAADFDYFSVPVPNDPRLPGAGQTIGNFPNVRVLKAQNNVVTFASNYGEQYRRWSGVDATIDARIRNGLLFQGGISTGKETTDNCEVVRKLPETIAGGIVQSLDYCHGEQPYQTHVKGLGSYSLPWWGLQISGAFQSSPQTGVQNVLGLTSIGGVQANVTYPNAVIAPSLGRNLSTGTTAVVNVLQLGKLYDDRLNQIDLRIAKRAHFGKSALQLTVDIYNVLNGDAVVNGENVTYGQYTAIGNTSWMRPTNTLQPRLFKLGARIDF